MKDHQLVQSGSSQKFLAGSGNFHLMDAVEFYDISLEFLSNATVLNAGIRLESSGTSLFFLSAFLRRRG